MLWITVLIIGDLFSFTPVNEALKVINPEAQTEPSFVSESGKYKFVTGNTILLPCDVEQADSYVIAWKKGIAILTAGKVKVSPDARMNLINGYSLQIKNSVPQDAGVYVCQIATLDPIEIMHTVDILVPPVIHHVTSGGSLQVKKGTPVYLECFASGNPAPNITWTRKNNILPNGEEKLSSPALTIENMDRHKGGTYICTANNGVGQAATSQVLLHVLYPPEIILERPIVHSSEGQEAMLVCIVHGEAPPLVTWYINTMQLHTTENHIMGSRGSRHTLLIRKVNLYDFGNYTCVAENDLGRTKKIIQLTGKPKMAVFHSPPISQWGDRYNISWAVDSHTPIEEFKLFFRRLPKGRTNDENNEDSGGFPAGFSEQLQPLQHQSQQQQHFGRRGFYRRSNSTHHLVVPAYESHWYRNGHGSIVHWSGNDWRDVILPAIPLSHLYTQTMSYLIHGLEPDHQYEAKVQARNRYGWSDVSDRFIFSTPNTNSEVRDMRSTQYNGASFSTYRNFISTLLTIILGNIVVISHSRVITSSST
ncbi:neural cell adhesion molecule 2-like [Phlebotomus argentipes]|uniref:neural cell adhesion molecule 2-like n=1 Tax=Phlebotomus argentipes TaxID=94469 RepID=UPI002892AC72|nr:neural cell adhesion molecule 2-like [Phlebotomus argentipes]